MVEFRNVSKSYPIYDSPLSRLRELLTLQQVSFHRDFWALRDVSFEIRQGETFCLVGENGSGKSTLLQLMAGIFEPTQGEVLVNGRLAALLELGAGFNPDFSGRDNVMLNAAILGLSTREIERRYPLIEQFAGIGNFIDQPVRTYSSGMTVRLGFSVAIHSDPEILLIDEALAVGDLAFQERCLQKVNDLRRNGVTIILVSHSPQDVKRMGERALWLDKGRMRQIGPADRVMDDYYAAMAEKDQRYVRIHPQEEPATGKGWSEVTPVVRHIPNIDQRSGDGTGVILGVAILDESGRPTGHWEPLRSTTLRVSVEAKTDLEGPATGFVVRNHLGMDFFASDTDSVSCAMEPMQAGQVVTVDFRIEMPELYPANFAVSVYFRNGIHGSAETCDSVENAITVQMSSTGMQVYGYLHVPCDTRIHREYPSRSARGAQAMELV